MNSTLNQSKNGQQTFENERQRETDSDWVRIKMYYIKPPKDWIIKNINIVYQKKKNHNNIMYTVHNYNSH